MKIQMLEDLKNSVVFGIFCGFLITAVTACSSVTWSKVETDVAGWYTAANVIWSDVGQKKTKPQIKEDLISGGVSEATAQQIINYLGAAELTILITKEVASNLDKLAAALASK